MRLIIFSLTILVAMTAFNFAVKAESDKQCKDQCSGNTDMTDETCAKICKAIGLGVSPRN